MASCSVKGATTNSASHWHSQFSSSILTLLITFLSTRVPWGLRGSWIRIGGIGRVGMSCSITLSSDMTLIMAPQSAREEGREAPSTSAAILIVGKDLGREY